MKQLFILLSILLISPPLFGNSKKGQTLFFWQTPSSLSWKEFGDKKFHPKYQGDVESNKPNGLGMLTYPWGESILENGKTEDCGTEKDTTKKITSLESM